MNPIAHALLFDALWFVCVRFRGVAGAAAAASLALLFVALARDRARVARFVVAASLAGFLADSLLERAGLFAFAGGPRPPGAAPLWVLGLWLAFATLPPGCLAGLRGRPVLAALLGAAAGPLSYALGARIGAVSLGAPGYAAAAVEYAAAMPLLLRFAPGGSRG
jgi:hypothetical protein